MTESGWPDAFAIAGRARDAIATVVADVASERIDLAAAFERADADGLVGRTFAVKVIEVVPGIGKVRARRTMAAVGLAEDVALGGVDVAARQRLLAALSGPDETSA